MIFDREHYINQPLDIEKELRILFDTSASLTIFEIGACEGEDSIRYSNLFPNSTIYAFEPLKQNLARINSNINRYQKHNIAVVQLALSNKAGTAVFYVSSGAPEGKQNDEKWDFGNKSSSLLEPDQHIDLIKFIDFKTRIKVPTITLSDFCKDNGITFIDYIHMDVQGAELMVLAGAKEFIHCIKVIWLEVSKMTLYKDQPLYDDIKIFMEQNNFVLIKDAVDNISGDQLYISRQYYSDYQRIIDQLAKMNQPIARPSFAKRMLTKIRRTFLK